VALSHSIHSLYGMKFILLILMIPGIMSFFSISSIKRTKSVYTKAVNHLGSLPLKKMETNDKGLWTLQFDGGSRGDNAC
jgi:hypothetical protein